MWNWWESSMQTGAFVYTRLLTKNRIERSTVSGQNRRHDRSFYSKSSEYVQTILLSASEYFWLRGFSLAPLLIYSRLYVYIHWCLFLWDLMFFFFYSQFFFLFPSFVIVITSAAYNNSHCSNISCLNNT